VDPEIIDLQEIIKKEEINASKTYNLPGKFAELAELHRSKALIEILQSL